MIKEQQVFLYLYLVKHNRIVEYMQSILHMLPRSLVFTHVGIGFSNMKEYLSAEWEKVKWMPNPTLRLFPRGVEIYKVPISYERAVVVRKAMDEYNNMPYDRYIYALWTLRVMSIFIPLMSLLAGLVSMDFMFVFLFVLGIIYIPVSKWLKNKSKKSWACSMLTSMILEEFGGIKFDVGKNWGSITPVIMRMLVKFSGWERVKK